MDHHQRSLRFGAALIAAALMFRLAGSGMFQSLANFLAQPNIASFLLYLETGRIVRFSQSPAERAKSGIADSRAKASSAPGD